MSNQDVRYLELLEQVYKDEIAAKAVRNIKADCMPLLRRVHNSIGNVGVMG